MLLTVGDQQSVDQLTSFFHVATWDISCSVIMPIRLPAICDYHQTRSPLEKGLHVWGLSHMGFHTATTNCASSRHSILRLWRGPSPRAYSRGIISHELSYRCGELCLFEALYPAPLARPFSKGLHAGIISHGLSCYCDELCLFEALYPAPLARPFSKGLRTGIISHGLSCRCGELCLFEALYPAPLARPFSKGLRAGGIC